MKALVALMAAILLAVGAARAVDATTPTGCHIDFWPVPRTVCPLDPDTINQIGNP
jgi:hypothetical protein